MTVRALLLAAGQSRRFGSDKRRVKMPDGDILINALLRRLRKAGVAAQAVLAVNDDLLPEVDGDCLFAANAALGMGCSIADAVGEVAADRSVSAIMILPVDLPLIRVSSLAAVARAASEHAIVQARHGDRAGHPVAFGRSFFAELARLQGDGGAQSIVRANPASHVCLEVNDPGIFLDGDTSAEMQTLLARLSPKGRY